MEDYRFKVNLGGMIEILSDHLYSSPDVYVRELLQNATDAIVAYKKITSNTKYEGQIIIETKNDGTLTFTDNGQGLTQEEIHQFLAIIGESSKRDLENGKIKSDYIGRFGIGLLSCFMVSDEITMITRSCKENPQLLKWCGKPDGTYSIDILSDDSNYEFLEGSGTKVILHAKSGMEKYFTNEYLKKMVTYYGILLPFPVIIKQFEEENQINPTYLPWEGRETNKQELMIFGQMMFNEQFFDCIKFHSEEGNVSGVAYISQYAVLPSAKLKHRIYLKNMLLTENGDNLIPEWAVFTRCIINSTDLRPTASREGFYVDEVLETARTAIEDAIIDYITDIAENRPQHFENFFHIHNLSLMSLALATPKLFNTLIDYFEFETTCGTKTGYDLRMSKEPLIYAPTREKYTQLSQLFFAQNQMLINVSYVHSLALLHQLGQSFDISVNAVDDFEIDELMTDLSIEASNDCFNFLKKANHILKEFDCKAEIKNFLPSSQPTFYLINENILLKRQIMNSRSQANAMFFNMLDAFASDISDDRAATLYFNYNNSIVKKILSVEEEAFLKTILEILYVQALQIGGFSLHNNEMSILNHNILSLIERGLSDV